MNILFLPQKTLLRESKDLKNVLSEVSLDIGGEHSLLHVLTDPSEDYAQEGRKGGNKWSILLPNNIVKFSDISYSAI